jgi:hypothetical protein
MSVLRFLENLKRIYQHTGAVIVPHALVRDNKAMVKKINEILPYNSIYPNTTMDSEWDVLAEIKASLDALREER